MMDMNYLRKLQKMASCMEKLVITLIMILKTVLLTATVLYKGPVGTRAGVIWQVEDKVKFTTEIEPEKDRWGVYNIWFTIL
ncbi:hypothetical protein D1970_11655 [Mesobacillus zeae]|uniref:Uncharacterized protein n=1 Tax=Mesobacillus zeae TaxID=1917180 RepID=A0A398B6A6_9BACI|nr:hypothetical protein D1970_11655 [Mesobacillus zeae]